MERAREVRQHRTRALTANLPTQEGASPSMARIRTIKPEFFTSLSNAELSIPARLTFIGLWTHCDDEGRCIDDARLIRAAIWPLERNTKAVENDLAEIEKQGKILRYEGAGKRLIQITEWKRHQHINRAKPSRLPGPDTEASWTHQ